MQNLEGKISSINQKIQKLIKKYNELKKYSNESLEELSKAKLKLGEANMEIESLRNQNLILKASLKNLDEKDKKELEQKINGFIKTLDKTISQLSQ